MPTCAIHGGPGGSRTHPVLRVKKPPPHPGGHRSKLVLRPGIEPGFRAYRARVLPLNEQSGETENAPRENMVGWCGFDPLPCGRVLRTRCRSHRLSQPNTEPPLRIKLRSARYRRAALSLCYGGMAEPGRIERLTLRSLRCSKSREEPTSAGSNWRKAAGADPLTFRSHSVSNGSPGPPGIAFQMAERDRHRTIGHRWPPSTSNTVEEPTSARSKMADDKKGEFSARRPRRVSGARPEPFGDVIRIWYPQVRFERTLPGY